MWYIVMEYNNRRETKRDRLPTINKRTWTRRIRWFEGESLIKLKLEDNAQYKEILASVIDAKTIWQRFRDNQSIEDCISILGREVPVNLQSKRAANQ